MTKSDFYRVAKEMSCEWQWLLLRKPAMRGHRWLVTYLRCRFLRPNKERRSFAGRRVRIVLFQEPIDSFSDEVELL